MAEGRGRGAHSTRPVILSRGRSRARRCSPSPPRSTARCSSCPSHQGSRPTSRANRSGTARSSIRRRRSLPSLRGLLITALHSYTMWCLHLQQLTYIYDRYLAYSPLLGKLASESPHKVGDSTSYTNVMMLR